ncbi:MAG: hypothetical protein P1V13_01205 [Rhizobiaceae bacterium]|nr:hypothetical protein [Rhizobiaceae bacterium]
MSGAVIGSLGIYFNYTGGVFQKNSNDAKLNIVKIESKRVVGRVVYRPRFEAIGDYGKSVQYSGHGWFRYKPYENGDVVDGRVNWATGEIRSMDMITSRASLGKNFAVIGSINFLLGLIFFMGKRWRFF